MNKVEGLNSTYWYTCEIGTDKQISLVNALRSLSSEELLRVDSFKFLEHKEQYIRARGFLRATLGKLMNCSPTAIEFFYNSYGKPNLLNNQLYFNLSKSKDLVVIAVSEKTPIGIDIEFNKNMSSLLTTSLSVFTSNEHIYLKNKSNDEKLKAFYELWTAKEAHLKRLGVGLKKDPREAKIIFRQGKPYKCISPTKSSSKLIYININYENYHCCIAT
jgi:phosphopantetheine--protein transferase-like protein